MIAALIKGAARGPVAALRQARGRHQRCLGGRGRQRRCRPASLKTLVKVARGHYPARQ